MTNAKYPNQDAPVLNGNAGHPTDPNCSYCKHWGGAEGEPKYNKRLIVRAETIKSFIKDNFIPKEEVIEIKSWFNGSVLFEYECEDNTVTKTLEKAVSSSADLRYADLRSANLRYANLRYADLSYADLSYADLSYANLRYADLSYADLRYANLRSADLSYANLSYANLRSADLRYTDLSYGVNLSSATTDKRYIQISCIGSAKRMTTYCFEDDIIWCGCFKGTLEEFEKKVRKTHKKNPQYLKEYIGAIKYIKSLIS